jgi:virulence-associated protein VagC
LEEIMKVTTKVFRNGQSQAIRIPKQFRVNTQEVYIKKENDRLIIEPKPAITWEEFLSLPPLNSGDQAESVERIF